MATIKTHTLTPADVKFLEARAPHDAFLANVQASYATHRSLTDKMHTALVKAKKDYEARPRVAGVRVANRFLRDGKAICRECPPSGADSRLATKAVGEYGYCEPDHYTKAAQALAGADPATQNVAAASA